MGSEIRNVLDAIAGSWIPKAAIISFAISLAITLAIAVTQNVYTWVDSTPPRGIATIDVGRLGMVAGTSGTAAAFLVTLYAADRNYRRGREHIPNLTMELQVVRVPASLQYDAVMVALNSKNTGTGLCRVNRVIWQLKVVSPYDDETIQEMEREFDGTPASEQDIEFPWRLRKEETVTEGIVIEPNETEQMTYDFIIPAEITAIVVSAWVSNASEPREAEGWYRRTVHVNEEAST
jgi:hypothetical protein